MKRTLLGLLVSGLACASPARVVNCVHTARNAHGATVKQATVLCRKFKSNAGFTCFEQGRALGLDGDQSATLCAEAESLVPLNCFRLVSTTTGLTAAESASVCSGDKL